MQIKERKWNKCKKCNSRLEVIQEEEYDCDCCKKKIPLYEEAGKNHADYLSMTVHQNGDSNTDTFNLCSWKCIFKFLESVKCDYFVSLPLLSYEKDMLKGQRIEDFWEAIKEF